jgi:hypothetical protein
MKKIAFIVVVLLCGSLVIGRTFFVGEANSPTTDKKLVNNGGCSGN